MPPQNLLNTSFKILVGYTKNVSSQHLIDCLLLALSCKKLWYLYQREIRYIVKNIKKTSKDNLIKYLIARVPMTGILDYIIDNQLSTDAFETIAQSPRPDLIKKWITKVDTALQNIAILAHLTFNRAVDEDLLSYCYRSMNLANSTYTHNGIIIVHSAVASTYRNGLLGATRTRVRVDVNKIKFLIDTLEKNTCYISLLTNGADEIIFKYLVDMTLQNLNKYDNFISMRHDEFSRWNEYQYNSITRNDVKTRFNELLQNEISGIGCNINKIRYLLSLPITFSLPYNGYGILHIQYTNNTEMLIKVIELIKTITSAQISISAYKIRVPPEEVAALRAVGARISH